MAIKKSDLYSSLWASCDELRGGMDASQYKDYVLFMLFIKYISDKYGNSNDFAPAVTIPFGASFKDMVALKGNPDIGNKINTQIIQPLIDANARLARSDFPDFNDPSKLGEGKDMVEKLTNLVAIFEKPELDFSKNRADNDDILGDAYEYLMRHFASESGKSKGQFYTPSEVSRIIAKVIGISPANAVAATTVYDPTCGSGSLLLKVADQAGKHITLEGQEMDVTTAGLARMNMILHDFPTANILQGNTLSTPKFKDGEQLRTYDYVVANPPFSVKTWSVGITPGNDPYQRFAWGEPPAKQGDYAFLLHIIRSMKNTGKAACILPHGVLFRGNAEAVIREQLVRSGYLKAIIGLPANLFYGTGIPACILVLDKENASARKGIFMIDAAKGFTKDGPKNRLRDQDVHKIVDAFTRMVDVPRYARMVAFDEISDPKNDFNLNLPRYIDSTEPEDIQDIDGHLRGGIPERDIDAFDSYWQVMPALRTALFKPANHAGYFELVSPEVKPVIFGHPQFTAFKAGVDTLFNKWLASSTPQLKGFAADAASSHPKELIFKLSEELLSAFAKAPLLDHYDIYQHLMDYWAETMQDDCYLISADGWKAGATVREIHKVKDKNNKLVWAEKHDYSQGKRRFKSDLIPVELLVARYFSAERSAIEGLETELASIEQSLSELLEEHSGEDGSLSEVIEGEGDKQKVTAKAIKARQREIGKDPDYEDELKVLAEYASLLDQQSTLKTKLKNAEEDLDNKIHAKYPQLSEAEIKTLVVDDKWLATLAAAVQGELDRVSQTLTSRIRELSERYSTPLPLIVDEVATLASRVDEHLKKMGAAAIQQLLTGQTRLPGFEGEWEIVSMREVLSQSATYGIVTAGTFVQNGVKMLRGGDIADGRINTDLPMVSRAKAAEYVRTTLVQDDVVIALVGYPGATAKIPDELIGANISRAVGLLRLNGKVTADFLVCFLNSPGGRRMVLAPSAGSAQQVVNLSALNKLQFTIPPLPEQTAIATVLTDMDAELAALEKRLAKTRAIKQGVMQELLTGRTRLV